jgi:hypothetical protein
MPGFARILRHLDRRFAEGSVPCLTLRTGRITESIAVGLAWPHALLLAGATLLAGAASAAAQEPSEPSEDEVAEARANANNPLADIRAFNIQNYWVPKLYGIDDEAANTFWARLAVPTGPVLWRLSVPLPTVPTPAGPESGLGDLQLFAAYLAVQKPTFSFGIGPQLAFPTASDDALGTGKYQAGLATVVFAIPDPKFQVGGLVLWQASYAGDSERDNTNVLAVQPFAFWQLGGGTYLRTAPIWAFNLESGDYNVPFGFGIGQVVGLGRTVFNIFVEPQFTILHDGVGQPAFQLYTALNMQFIKKKKE